MVLCLEEYPTVPSLKKNRYLQSAPSGDSSWQGLDSSVQTSGAALMLLALGQHSPGLPVPGRATGSPGSSASGSNYILFRCLKLGRMNLILVLHNSE